MENFDVVQDSYSRSKEDFWLEKHNLQIPIYSFYLSFELTFDRFPPDQGLKMKKM